MERFEMARQGLVVNNTAGPFCFYADAQATIAALQAKLEDLTAKYQNLVAWYDKQNGTPCEQVRHRQEVEALQARGRELEAQHEDLVERNRILRHRPDLPVERTEFHDRFVKLQSQLTQRTAERDTARRRVDELEAREVDVVLLRDDLEQRTAELEAATRERDEWIVKWDEHDHYPKGYVTAQIQLRERVQAELERVRADNKALDEWRADVTVSLQRPGGAFFVDVPQHIKDLVKERDDLRTLIAALPKVEGEIEVSSGVYNFILLKHDSGTRFLCGQIETEQTAKAIAALLQHRQGMEG